jgi:hypothetical protein
MATRGIIGLPSHELVKRGLPSQVRYFCSRLPVRFDPAENSLGAVGIWKGAGGQYKDEMWVDGRHVEICCSKCDGGFAF